MPRSFASSSSKENETIKAKKQRSPSVTADSDIQYPKLPNFAKKQPAPASDKRKSKRNAYDYDDNIDDDSTYSIPTLSRSLTTSSTGSLEEATSKARIAPTSSTITPKIRRMPEDNKIDQAHEASSCARTPTVSKAIKRGSSAIKPGQDPPQTVRKTSQSEKDIANDAEPRRMRSSSPAIDRRKAARKAKPAAKEKVYSSGSAAYDGSEHKTGVASSSSKSRQDYPQDRRPLTEKAALPSSSKNRKDTAVNVPAYKTKGKGRITDLTSSSPEKSRPITLSSSLHNGINEQDEDSVVVATSSTLREPSRSTYGAPSKAPVSSSVLEAMYTRPVDRGKPSPVFKTKSPKKDQRQAKSDSDRPRAKPAAKPPARPMEYPAPESSSQPRRLATSNTSPKKRAVEVVVEASPAFKKRANGLVKSEVREDEERRTKRRSVEREIQRSDSPFEQTQALWRKAAIGDSFDLDYDVKMEESDSDTDGDVRLTDFQEIGRSLFALHFR